MEHANALLTNLAVVLCVAAATTVVFQRLALAGTHESIEAARALLTRG